VSAQSSLSLQYVPFQVLPSAFGPIVNPTSDPVQFAFTLGGADPAVWYAGSWAGTTALLNGAYTALCLVGPGGTVALPRGTYSTWIKITDSPEIPVIGAGQLQIT
jgi:hypothetical protein